LTFLGHSDFVSRHSYHGLRFISVPLIAAALLDLFAGPPIIAGLWPREFCKDLLDEATTSGRTRRTWSLTPLDGGSATHVPFINAAQLLIRNT
jgi:hypothetical protein